MAKESNDLAKVLLDPNQKSNELSMNIKMWTEIHSGRQEIFTKVLGADKDKVRRNQTITLTTQMPCGFLQSED